MTVKAALLRCFFAGWLCWFNVEGFCAEMMPFVSPLVEGMSEEELREKSLGLAKHALSGKSELERAAILHQHMGSRAVGDMVIETYEPASGKPFIHMKNWEHIFVLNFTLIDVTLTHTANLNIVRDRVYTMKET